MADTPSELREEIVHALKADLVGPFDPASGEEVLPLPPSRWYLTGFLAPQGGREAAEPTDEDPNQDDQFAIAADEDGEEAEGTGGETEPKQKNRLPASMGLSVLLPAGPVNDSVRVTVAWAEYEAEEREKDSGRGSTRVWRRQAQPARTVEVPLDPARILKGIPLTGDGVRLAGRLETVDIPRPGTRALALFVVNGRAAGEKGRQDERFLFQVEMAIEHAAGIVPRAILINGEETEEAGAVDADAQISDLQFRNCCDYAVGHGVSVDVVRPEDGGAVTRVKTAWIPRAEVPRVKSREVTRVVTGMDELGALDGGEALRRALEALPEEYGAWIAKQRRSDVGSPARGAARDGLMDEADQACRRIAAGIELVAGDPEIRLAFQLANRAMAESARRRSPERYTDGKVPKWHLFQLAFVLLNLPGLADEKCADRETVELIFFPTGGGKTEAYLGVIAVVLLLRRLRGRERPDGGLGVAVLLRYTLRLLTLDQLARAATLVCALEVLRRQEPGRLGRVRFAVGLWVGKSATANTMSEVKLKILTYKNRAASSTTSPFPLTLCPWCGAVLGPDSLQLDSLDEPREVLVGCSSFRCDFAAGRHPEGLPVLFVDEQVYRELPAFLLATVDKLAMMPWRGEAGMLFGRVQYREENREQSGRRFWGPVDAALGETPRGALVALPEGLRPPELIVQDELHLISGPLGTMAGLYETAVEALCARTLADGAVILPKILASTATVRRAREQIHALFGRRRTAVFPPPGPDVSETWFSEVDTEVPGRLYLGIAGTGRAMKAILLRVYVALLAAAERLYAAQGPGSETADAYMTLVGYFNSLRELGGMRRLVEDEVRTRSGLAEARKPLGWDRPHPWFRDRKVGDEPVELTSRENVGKIKKSKDRLAKPHSDPEHVDVVLASNMISVGVDIERLGLMVVAGQPKATSEYIQASSRVGRQAARPGLVVTCFNLHKPRDRSHYERFPFYHESFYRFVEVSSLTPFSGPALDRGLAGTLLAMARLDDPALTPATAAMRIADHRAQAEKAVQQIAERAAGQPDLALEKRATLRTALVERGRALVAAWERLALLAPAGGYLRAYSPYDRGRGGAKAMLSTVLDPEQPQEEPEVKLFTAPTSMRDVEPVSHLWLKRGRLGGHE